MTIKPFDKEKFIYDCCREDKINQDHKMILDKIAEYKDKDQDVAKVFTYYRDHLWQHAVEFEVFRQAERDLGRDEYNKLVAKSLRAMADKIEEKGPHFIISAVLPELPIFKDGDFSVENYMPHISVTMVKCPLGG